MNKLQTAQVDRPERRLESFIGQVHSLNNRSKEIAGRLKDMRQRLLGLHEPENDDPSVNEAVASETDDLRIGLKALEDSLEQIESYVGSLESV